MEVADKIFTLNFQNGGLRRGTQHVIDRASNPLPAESESYASLDLKLLYSNKDAMSFVMSVILTRAFLNPVTNTNTLRNHMCAVACTVR